MTDKKKGSGSENTVTEPILLHKINLIEHKRSLSPFTASYSPQDTRRNAEHSRHIKTLIQGILRGIFLAGEEALFFTGKKNYEKI